MNGYYEAVVEILKRHGYTRLRSNGGSHEIWSNGMRSQTVSKNMPSRHMANTILKQAAIKEHIT